MSRKRWPRVLGVKSTALGNAETGKGPILFPSSLGLRFGHKCEGALVIVKPTTHGVWQRRSKHLHRRARTVRCAGGNRLRTLDLKSRWLTNNGIGQAPRRRKAMAELVQLPTQAPYGAGSPTLGPIFRVAESATSP